MAAQARRQQRTKRGTGRASRWMLWVAGALLLAAVVSLPALRWWWGKSAANPLRSGVAALRVEGCIACHGQGDGAVQWRASGPPPSVDAIRDALLNGRPGNAGFAAAMPPYGERLAPSGWRPLALAVAASAGLVGVPEEPETAAGMEILVQMGCFGCHGELGAGGVSNPGSLRGEVPGFYGAGVARLVASGRLAEVIRDGARPRRLPPLGFAPPPLVMPGFGDRLDSTELDLAQRAVRWLNENPPDLP